MSRDEPSHFCLLGVLTVAAKPPLGFLFFGFGSSPEYRAELAFAPTVFLRVRDRSLVSFK